MATANTWRLTDAARTALADGANRGVREVSFSSLAVGSGHAPAGAGNDALTALRTQTDTGALSGATSATGRIALEATIVSTAAYDVTEVGVFARIGMGAEFLAAYWTDDGRAVAASAAAGDTLVLAGVIDVQAAAADVTVTVNPALTLNPPASLNELLTGLDNNAYVRVNEAAGQRSLEGLTRAALLADLLDGLADESFVRVRDTDGVLSLRARSQSQTLSDLLTGIAGDRYVRVAEANGARSFEALTRAQVIADFLTGIDGSKVLGTNADGAALAEVPSKGPLKRVNAAAASLRDPNSGAALERWKFYGTGITVPDTQMIALRREDSRDAGTTYVPQFGFYLAADIPTAVVGGSSDAGREGLMAVGTSGLIAKIAGTGELLLTSPSSAHHHGFTRGIVLYEVLSNLV